MAIIYSFVDIISLNNQLRLTLHNILYIVTLHHDDDKDDAATTDNRITRK